MGILNVTPDSFSDGGAWNSVDAAVARGFQLVEQGADMIDIGGESTRPGAQRVSESEEWDRVIPVVAALAPHLVVSVDTMRSSVARAAVKAGAQIINDVSGGLADPGMAQVVADTGAGYVCMHWRGFSDAMDQLDYYHDVVGEVRQELELRVHALRRSGVMDEQIIIDPGLGFAKRSEANWPLVAQLNTLIDERYPVLVGASRKRFLGEVMASSIDGDDYRASRADQRDHATTALTALVAQAGAWAVRVHDVAASADAVRVAAAVCRASGQHASSSHKVNQQDSAVQKVSGTGAIMGRHTEGSTV